MPNADTSMPQHMWSRTVYVVAFVWLLLLWLLVWSWRDDGIVPTSERESDGPTNVIAPIEPLITIPDDMGTLCTSDTYNVGQWVRREKLLRADKPSDIEKVAGYHCSGGFPHKCYRRLDEGNEFNRSKHIMDYVWEPSGCELVPFDAKRFAEYLSNHPLVFVGDSINQLEFESMGCLLGEKLTSPPGDTQLSGGDRNMWVSQFVHQDKLHVEGAVTMAYLRSDYLVRLDDFKLMEPNDDEGYIIGKGTNFPWVHALSRFDHIVINTAAHWHTDLKWGPNESDEEMMDAYRRAMRIIFDYLQRNLRPVQRVWVRSTPYGHAKCSRYTEPSKTPFAPTRKEGEFQWDMFDKMDQVWKEMIDEAQDYRIRFFNVSNMANLRGDAHSRPDSDCLHTCLPGPVDDWNKLLFHEIAREAAGSA